VNVRLFSQHGIYPRGNCRRRLNQPICLPSFSRRARALIIQRIAKVLRHCVTSDGTISCAADAIWIFCDRCDIINGFLENLSTLPGFTRFRLSDFISSVKIARRRSLPAHITQLMNFVTINAVVNRVRQTSFHCNSSSWHNID